MEELGKLTSDNFRLEKENLVLRRGNTVLLEALMWQVLQGCAMLETDDEVVKAYYSCDHTSLEVLVEAGLAEKEGDEYRLLWDKLDKRKERYGV
jgi:hypothetical protein